MTTSSHAVVVMARAPDGARPPKTRLAGIVPDERQRRRLYAAFLSDIVGRCGSLRNTALHVAYAADGGTAGFERAGVRADCLMPQRGETLGERERGVFEDLFLAGFSAVVMIGSDLPTLPIDRVTGALARLRDASRRVVLGPAADGGYYLIGLTRPPAGAPVPDLFSDIRWSTGSACADTIAAAARCGLQVALLDGWYDVDDAAGFTRLRDDLATDAGARLAPATTAVLKTLTIFRSPGGPPSP